MGTRRSQIVSVAVEQVDKDKLTTLFRKSNGVDTLTRIHVSVWSNQKQVTESKSMGTKKYMTSKPIIILLFPTIFVSKNAFHSISIIEHQSLAVTRMVFLFGLMYVSSCFLTLVAVFGF